MKHIPRHHPPVERLDQSPVSAAASEAQETLVRQVATAQTLLQRSTPDDLDKTLLMALSVIGRAMQACRAYVFRVDSGFSLDNTHEWCADGVASVQAQLQNVRFSDGDPFWRAFEQSGIVAVRNLDHTRPESRLRQVLDGQDIRALLACALWHDDQIAGLVGLDFTGQPRDFSDAQKNLLRAFAASVSLALQNRDHAQALARAKAQLSATQARLSAAVSQTPRLLVETDADGVITGFVQDEPLIFAMAPNEVIGAAPEQVLPAHVAAIVRRAMHEVDNQGHSASHSYPLDLGGVEKWFTLRASAREAGPQGSTAGYLFVVTDISETRRQQILVRQLGRVAELSNNLIFLTDRERKITWVNPAGLTRTGLELAQTLGRCPSDVLGLEHSDPGQTGSIRASLEAEQPVNSEVACLSRHGIRYWLELNVQPLHEPEGEVQGYMVVGVDITAHKLAEARALRDRMQTLAASREGYAILWPDGRVAFINPELRKLLGLAADMDTSALLWTDITTIDFAERMVTILPELIQQGFWSGEIFSASSDARKLSVDLSLTVQDDGSFFAVVRDITARRQAEAEQAQLRAQLQVSESRLVMSQMAAGLAHDLANLLTVISGSVSIVEAQGAANRKQSLTRIRQATAQAQNLVTTLMQFGRAEARRVPTDIAEQVRLTCQMLGATISAPIEWTSHPDDMRTIAEPTQVMQVIVNLVMNADRAVAQAPDRAGGHKIRVHVARQTVTAPTGKLDLGFLVMGQAYIVTTVTDTGPGIPQEVRKNLFAPFVSAGAQRGTGLGMAIVAHIVHAHGGAVQIDTSPEGGASVSVFWPVGEATSDPNATLPNPAAKPLDGMNVLLVDDDDQILQHLSTILSQAGAETVSCDNPKDAISAILDDPTGWDVLVSDYDMGSMNGLELAQDVRRIAPLMRIVLVTGAASLQNANLVALNLQGAILRKPIAGPELIACLLHAKLRQTHALTLE